MSKFSIRREPGKKDIFVTAGDDEGEYLRFHQGVTYHCPCMVNGRNCMAKMRHVSKSIARYPNKIVDRPAYFASFNEQTKHIEGCPNSKNTTQTVKMLSKAPERIFMDKFMNDLIGKRKCTPKKGGGDKPKPKTGETTYPGVEENGDEIYVYRNVCSVKELYQVLVSLDTDTILGDGKTCENVLMNSRNYKKVRNGDLILNGCAIVLAEICRYQKVRDEYRAGDRGNNIFVLQDPFITKNYKKVFFVLEFPDKFVALPDYKKEKIINRLVKEKDIWLVYGRWQLLRQGTYTIYHTKINHPNQFAKLKNADEIENYLRIAMLSQEK